MIQCPIFLDMAIPLSWRQRDFSFRHVCVVLGSVLSAICCTTSYIPTTTTVLSAFATTTLPLQLARFSPDLFAIRVGPQTVR